MALKLIESIDLKLTLLLEHEASYLERIKKAAEAGRLDEISELNDMYIAATKNTERYKSGLDEGVKIYHIDIDSYKNDGLVSNESLSDMTEDILIMSGIFPLGKSMFTTSLICVQANIAKMMEMTGLKRVGIESDLKRLCKMYNKYVGFDCY